MKEVFSADSRGITKIDWLTSFHSFSFGSYYNPSKRNFGSLRVINDDYIEPGGGFPTHPHNNMEIVTIVLEGELSHTDSTGNDEIIRYGEIQKMSAGKGIFHSEFNDSKSERIHLLQIWIIPDKMNIQPSYEKVNFPPAEIKNKLFKIAGGSGDNTVHLNQNAELYLSEFEQGKTLSFNVGADRQVYIHVINGEINIDETALTAGDAYGIDEQGSIQMNFAGQSRFILFDLIKE